VTRAAPQLNIFAIGFPFMLLIGLIIIFVSIGGYLPHFDQHTREAMKFMTTILIL
jgi:flagellar biosynthetic protein FliR